MNIIKQIKFNRLLNDPSKIDIINEIFENIYITNSSCEIEFLIDYKCFIIFNMNEKAVYINKNITKLYFEHVEDFTYIFIYEHFYKNFQYLLNKKSITKIYYRDIKNYVKIKVKNNETLLKYL